MIKIERVLRDCGANDRLILERKTRGLIYDYNVLVNGEHRGTFKRKSFSVGYYLHDGIGNKLTGWDSWQQINKADFAETAAKFLPQLPTVAEVERYKLIVQAEQDNRTWDEERMLHNATVRRQMLSEALTQYIDNAGNPEDHNIELRERLAAAKGMLNELNGEIASAAERTK